MNRQHIVDYVEDGKTVRWQFDAHWLDNVGLVDWNQPQLALVCHIETDVTDLVYAEAVYEVVFVGGCLHEHLL